MKKRINPEEYQEVIKYLKEDGFPDMTFIEENNMDDIVMIRNTLNFQLWQLRNAYKNFAEAMRETWIGNFIISTVEFLNRCIGKL